MFASLLKEKTAAVDTVMRNRRGLSKAFGKKLKKSECLFQRKDHVMAVKWRDTRDVFMLSTRHNFTVREVNEKKKKKGIVKNIKPDVVTDYNKCQVGVDKAYQLLSHYAFEKKTIKWWKKLFLHLLMILAVKSYKIFRMMPGKSETPLCDYLSGL